MPFTFTMPKLSPTMDEGTIAKWHKKEGEFVEAGETILEIATDKATVEHTALDEGWLRKILLPEGQNAIVNQPIAIFTETKDESIKDYVPEEIKVEAKVEAPAEKEKVIVAAATPAGPTFTPEPPLEKYSLKEVAAIEGERIIASPLAKRLAKEQGLDLTTVKGSGPGGRITSRDLEMAQPAGVVSFGKPESPVLQPGTYEEIPLTPVRKIIAERLQQSKSTIPHFYVKQIVDASPLIALREQLKNLDLKVTFNDMVIRAVALALRKHPNVNTGFHAAHQTIIQFKTIDIAVAVSIEDGLITPIIRHADHKNLGQIAQEIRLLAEKARKGKLSEEEYRGGSFSITNLGMFGITEFGAIINPPQAAILAIGGIEDRPVVKEGQVVAGKTLTLVISADHRVIDGVAAAQFLKTLQQLLENPVALTI
ncbi:MAG: Dihydrolipoyllysine-residue acetyltransferase component of pyruvate dehydrogenase complex [Chlamydiae bacterium]|nr:Dihydrolipoyllysine-residue acetyltransferase component of pyruvate dehydrogenase complex [Chlamydiota bacterium]